MEKSEQERGGDPVLARNLRQRREDAGLSQEKLAELAGVSRPTIANIELGKYFPRWGTMMRIAQALKCAPEDLSGNGRNPPIDHVERFLLSDWARVIKPEADEVKWLKSLPVISWLGGEPTDETFARLLEGLRARKKG